MFKIRTSTDPMPTIPILPVQNGHDISEVLVSASGTVQMGHWFEPRPRKIIDITMVTVATMIGAHAHKVSSGTYLSY